MSKKVQIFISFLAFVGLAVFFGCASVQDIITPCFISPKALDYTKEDGATFLPYTSLWDAKRVNRKMDYVYLVKKGYEKLEYEYLKGITGISMRASEEFQTTIFSPSGPVGALLPTLFGGTLGALLIRRPGDTKKK